MKNEFQILLQIESRNETCKNIYVDHDGIHDYLLTGYYLSSRSIINSLTGPRFLHLWVGQVGGQGTVFETFSSSRRATPKSDSHCNPSATFENIMEKEKDYNTQNRYSTFPRTKNGQPRSKRPLADPDKIDQKTDESTNRLRKKQATSNAVYKEACDPWKRYRKSFRINQAGAAYIAHANNQTFEEKVIKQVKTVRGELSKISTSHHQNIVHLFESLFHDEAIYLVYEIMDISLGQIFSSPLGRLQLFEVAAFSREILIGLQHIHESLKISHGSLDSSTILLSVKGDVKIGKAS
jgi:hypothetical protein